MTRLKMRSVPRRRWRTRTGEVQPARGRDRHEIDYLRELPPVVPNGLVLVHNGVRPISPIPGVGGSRCWLQCPSGRLEPCDCDWAPEMGVHFRVCRTT
jgi:hypothetical protein